MLEKIDLGKKIEKKEFKQLMPVLRNQLYAMQKASWDADIPVIIIFEGWDAAGKGTSIQTLTARLDPRGFKLYPIRAARTYEKKHQALNAYRAQFSEEDLEQIHFYLSYKEQEWAKDEEFSHGEPLKVLRPFHLHAYPDALNT